MRAAFGIARPSRAAGAPVKCATIADQDARRAWRAAIGIAAAPGVGAGATGSTLRGTGAAS
jgi:hypothetical protein